MNIYVWQDIAIAIAETEEEALKQLPDHIVTQLHGEKVTVIPADTRNTYGFFVWGGS